MKKYLLILFAFLFSATVKAQAGPTTWTLSPQPVNGQYSAGQVVTMCFTMQGFGTCGASADEWFEGFDLNIGPGWASVVPVTAPANCGGAATGGQWIWQNTITTTATPPVTAGPGYFFDSAIDGNSANDFGDFGATCAWTFCVNLTVDNTVSSENLFVTVAPGPDGYFGSFTGNTCDFATPIVVLPTTTTIIGNPICSVTATNTSTGAALCAGSAVTLTASNASGATNYSWTGPNGYTATGQSVNIPAAQVSNVGLYTVTATGPSVACSGNTTVAVNPTPTINPTVSSPVCAGSPITLCSGAAAGAIVAWTGPNGYSQFVFPGANPCLTIAGATAAMTGNYQVTAFLNNCQTQQTLLVTVNPSPTATPISGITLCSGATVPAQAFAGTPAAGTTFTWTNNQTSIGLLASGTGGLPSFVATNNSATAVTAIISVVPRLGTCNGPAINFSIVVNPVPTITIPASNVFCEGAAVPAITWTTSSPAGTVAWTNNNTATGMGASGTGPILGFTASQVTTQTISTITATPSQGTCPGTPVTFTLTVNNAPNATITNIGPLCSNAGIQTLVAATSGGSWSGTGIINSSLGFFNPLIAGAVTTTITYTLSLPNQCPTSDVTQIQVVSVPVTNAGLNQSVCQGQTVNLSGSFTNSNTGSETFAWTPTINLTNTTTLTPTYTANSTQTYTLTVSSGGCSSSDDVVVTMLPQSNATINAAGPFCADVAPVVLTAAQSGGIWSGPGITNSTTGAFNPATATIGNNTIIYSIPGACPSIDTQTIVIYAVPNGTITSVGPLCQSDLPITLVAASTGGTWSGTGINSTSTGSFGSTTLAANTYTVTYNTGGNCPNNFTETIVVNANVDATITPQSNICADASPITFQAANLGGVWSGNGITNPATGTFDPSIVTPTTQTITYTISGACPDTDTQTIEVYPVYDGTITPAGPFCQALLPITLTAASAGGVWSGTGINNAATGSFGSTTLAGNSYTVTYTTAGSCPRVFNETIVVNANVDATIANVNPLCADVAAFNLTAADPGGTWSGTGITDAVAGTFDPSIATGNPTITYTIPGSCPSTDTQVITVYAVYDGTITPAGPFCQADLPITLTAASTGGTWSGTGINSTSAGTFGSTSLAANSYTITYTTQGNCSQANTTTVVVNASVDATISNISDLCNDAPAFNLSAVDGGGTWSGQGVSASGTFAPNSVTPNTYTITYSIGGACPDTDTQTIVVLPVPDGTITPAGPFCQDALPQTLSAASTGGAWSGTGITSSANGTFGASNTPAGNYSITYTTPGACSNSFNQVVQVIENLNATIGSAGPFCVDSSPFTLTAASSGGVWSGTGAITAGGQIVPSTLGAGTFTFNYNINNNGCLSSDNVQVIVNALPQPSFTTSTTSGCSPLSVTFTNTSNPLGSSCVWYVNGSPAGSGNTHSEIFTGSSCEDIGILITDAVGCSQSITMNDLVCVSPNPSASFTWSPLEPMLGGTVSFENTSLGGTTYNWDINGQGASGESVTYNVPAITDGQFTACLDVVGPGGCMDAQCYTVVVSTESYIFVPNSFTPDADGTNDVFAPTIVGLTNDYRYSFRVYNRWGDVIFETNDPSAVWTGNVHDGGYYAEAGAYVYEIVLQLRAGESPFKKVGSIVLLR